MNLFSDAEVKIDYCVPVMGRLEDLKRTLAHNISVLDQFGGRARLVVGCFDRDSHCEEWVRKQFPSVLDSGVLVFKAFKPLPYWHFSWAKNAFREIVSAPYYSSLDGDNSLSAADVSATLDQIRDSNEEVLIHHFSGNWGDGTSGRITFPTRLYRDGPYLDEILPRQFDELGVILRLLTRNPSLVFVSRPEVDIFEESGICREFIERNGLAVIRRYANVGSSKPPENPRGAGYVHRDKRLYFYQALNAAYTCWLYSKNDEARRAFLNQLESIQQEFTRSEACPGRPHVLFSGPGLDRLQRSEKATAYVVNRNNDEFLADWLSHYRALGVERFIVVDDYSDTALEQKMVGEDVYVVRPRFGCFRTSKVFWIKALMTMFQEPGSWALTVDIDEFMDIPDVAGEEDGSESRLARYLKLADRRGWRHIAGLLLDMMPDPDVSEIRPDNFIGSMNWYFSRPINDRTRYRDLGPVRWGFGEMWPISFAIDVRYRLFGTIDCLRKIPLIRFHYGMDLNQGFHGLTEDGHPLMWDEIVQPERGMLPVRHYKMARLFWSREGRDGPFERTEQYFGRTQENLARIAKSDAEYVRRTWDATPFKRHYAGPNRFPFLAPVLENTAR